MKREEVFSVLGLQRKDFEVKEQRFRWLVSFLCLPIAFKSFIFYFVFCFVLYQYPFYQVKKKAERRKEQIQYDFLIWLYQMNCFLQHHTVFNAMKVSFPYAPSLLREDLKKLCERLSKDLHSLSAYQSFLSQYDLLLIHETMRLFHRFNYLDQKNMEHFMRPLFERCQKDLMVMRKKSYRNRFEKRKGIFIVPMFILVYIFLRMMSLVMTQIFERGWMI